MAVFTMMCLRLLKYLHMQHCFYACKICHRQPKQAYVIDKRNSIHDINPSFPPQTPRRSLADSSATPHALLAVPVSANSFGIQLRQSCKSDQVLRCSDLHNGGRQGKLIQILWIGFTLESLPLCQCVGTDIYWYLVSIELIFFDS